MVPEDDASSWWNRAPSGGRGKWFSSSGAKQLGIKCRPLLLKKGTPPSAPGGATSSGVGCCRPEGSTFSFCLGIALPLACLEVRYMDGRAASRPYTYSWYYYLFVWAMAMYFPPCGLSGACGTAWCALNSGSVPPKRGPGGRDPLRAETKRDHWGQLSGNPPLTLESQQNRFFAGVLTNAD